MSFNLSLSLLPENFLVDFLRGFAESYPSSELSFLFQH
jgi:hypothetical protein